MFLANGADKIGITNYNNAIARVIANALVDGTISEVTGGKFSNGAMSAAFRVAFNDLANPKATKAEVEKEVRKMNASGRGVRYTVVIRNGHWVAMPEDVAAEEAQLYSNLDRSNKIFIQKNNKNYCPITCGIATGIVTPLFGDISNISNNQSLKFAENLNTSILDSMERYNYPLETNGDFLLSKSLKGIDRIFLIRNAFNNLNSCMSNCNTTFQEKLFR